MNILMLCNNASRVIDRVLQDCAKITHISRTQNLIQCDGFTLHLATFKYRSDLERFRGRKFDLIVEHDSLERSEAVYMLTQELRMMVLR